MGSVLAQPAAAAGAGADRGTLSWALAMLGTRKHAAQQHSIQPTDLWAHVLASLRRRRKMILGEDGQRSKRSAKQAYAAYLYSMRLAQHAMEQSRVLYAKALQYASPLQIAIGLIIASLMLFMTFAVVVRAISSSSRVPPHNAEKHALSDELDSDEFEYEEDSAEEETTSSGDGMTRKIRRALLPSHSHRRTGSRDAMSMGRRPSSIIRITSSDPRSQLSINAIQMDLDSSSQNMTRTGSNLGSNVRRRKESGRLLAGLSQDASALPPSTSSIPAQTARIIHTAARAAKQRRPSPRAPDHDRRPPRPDGPSKLRSSVASDEDLLQTPSSPNSVTSFSSALTGADDPEWHPIDSPSANSLASILRREPQRYAGLPELPVLGDGTSREPDNGFTSSWSNGLPTALSLDLSNGDQSIATSLPSSPSASHRLPPGAGYAQNSPLGRSSPVPALGTLSPEQARALWPEKRTRKVKLREPDWRPYTDLHERARERMQKFAELTGARSASPLLAEPGLFASDDESRTGTPTGDDGGEGEDEFWYERFTRSTAASGRDWDWRKRRARQAAALRSAAALEAIGGPDMGNTFASSGSPGPMVPPKLHDVASSTEGLLPSHIPPSPPLRSTSQGASQRPIPPLLFTRDSAHPVGGGLLPTGTSDYGNGGKRIRRHSDTDQAEADAAMGIPGRLSSLKPKGVKKMIVGRRGSGASPATLASVTTSPVEGNTGLEMTRKTPSRLEQEKLSPRRSSSVTQLDRVYARGATDLTTVRRPSPLAGPPSGWTEEHVYSSADAYGSATAAQHPVIRSNSLLSANLPSAPRIYDNEPVSPTTILPTTVSSNVSQVPRPPSIPRRRDTEPLKEVFTPQRLVIPARDAIREHTGRQSPSSRRDILLSAAQRSM